MEQVDHDRDGWVASDDEQKTFWRAKYLGNRRFQLTGPAVDQAAFGSAGVLRVWECGVGDRVRQSTSASLRRLARGVFELNTDVDVQALPARQQDGSHGRRQTGRRAAATERDGWLTVELPPSDAPYRLQVSP